MSIENKAEFNEVHIIEALDRCHTVMLLIDELLHLHPAIVKAVCNDNIERIADDLADVYQRVGQLSE